MNLLGVYIPIDRRHALAQGQEIPNRGQGTALFADISGFTPLTEALAQELGARRGAEELTQQLNAVYTALVTEVHLYRGCVIGFAGDAITCWFENDEGLRAISTALAMQSAMQQFKEIKTPGGKFVSLAIKTAVASGSVRRFLIGDKKIQLLDVLAGETLSRMAEAEHMAERGEVVATADVLERLSGRLNIKEQRTDEHGQVYGVVTDLTTPITLPPWPPLPANALTDEQMRPWLLPPVYNQLKTGQDNFLAELRPAATIFLFFTGINYDEDDQAGEKLNSYVSWVQNVLAKYEGFMLQVIMGDKGSYLYAAFGAPIAHGDDSARAVAAALELRHPPAELSFISETKIGISHGRLRAGAYGGVTRRTYGVIGDEVNTSARLMQKANHQQVLVSPAVMESSKKQFEFRPLGEIQLKGKAEPLPVYEALGLRSAQAEPMTMSFRPLIGRDETIAQMEEVLLQALAGKGQLLRVQGPAGMGKSHLSAEFTDRARRQGAQVFIGSCQSTTQSTPYYPWRQLFRALFNLPEMIVTEGQEVSGRVGQQIGQVEEQIRTINPDWELRLPLLGDLLGLPIPDNAATSAFDPRLRQEALFTLAVEIVQAKANLNPLLLFIDDIHWMDDASLGLTIALARAIGQQTVLFLLIHRPPLEPTKPILPAVNELPYHHFIDLQELTPEAVMALAAFRLGGPLAPLAGEVVQSQAQGNPFFTEELVEALRESKKLELVQREHGWQWELADHVFNSLREANCLVKQEGEWHLTQEVTLGAADLGIPDSIHGIVLSRLDRLPEEQKVTIKVASVIGRVFEFDLLRHSHPTRMGSAELRLQIDNIQDRDFVRLEMPEPRLSYMFKHNTMQEVAYDTLLFAQRRELHRTIALWYEQTFNQPTAGQSSDPLEAFYPLLAYHWRYAEDKEKERYYATKAAEQAAGQFANEDAIRYFTRALELTPEDNLEARYQLLLGREGVYSLIGKRDTQLIDLTALELLSQQLQSQDKQIDIYLRFADYYEATSNFELMAQQAEKAVILSEQIQNPGKIIDGLKHLGVILWRQGKLDEAQIKLQQALTIAQTSQDLSRQATIFLNLGSVSFFKYNLQEAQEFYGQSLEIYQLIGDIKREATALSNLAGVYFQAGDISKSKELSEKALNISYRIGDRRVETRILGNLGTVYHALGEFSLAEQSLRKSIEFYEAIGDRAGQSLGFYNLSLVFHDLEQYHLAYECSQKALNIDLEIGDQIGEGYSRTSLGLALDGLGQIQESEKSFQIALEIRQNLNQDANATENLIFLAYLAIKKHNHIELQNYIEQILAWLQNNSIENLEQPIKSFFYLANIFESGGDLQQTQLIIKEAYNFLIKRAEKISDLNARNSFLYHVPIHKRLIERYQQL